MIALFTGEEALQRALECSVEIQCGFQSDPVSSSFFEGLGVGVDYGAVLMGNLGGKERLDYSVIGAEVNLCARLCGAAGPDSGAQRPDRGEWPRRRRADRSRWYEELQGLRSPLPDCRGDFRVQ